MPRNVNARGTAAQRRIRALLLIGVASCVPVTAPVTAPVRYDETDGTRALFRIQGSQRLSADEPSAHAFLVDRGSEEPLVLTAHHVAGPIETAAPVSPGVWAWLRTPFSPSTELRAGERVPITGARTIDATSSQHDLAAFRVVDWDASRALELATALPVVGDTVWVLALHIPQGDNPHPLSGPRRHSARVYVANDSAFVYAYLLSANADFTSGAAVLDRDGRVVGVNVGTRVMTAAAWDAYRARYVSCCEGAIGGEVVGLAVGIGSIRAHLTR